MPRWFRTRNKEASSCDDVVGWSGCNAWPWLMRLIDSRSIDYKRLEIGRRSLIYYQDLMGDLEGYHANAIYHHCCSLVCHANRLYLLIRIAMANVSYCLEPVVLQVDEGTRNILEKARWMLFLLLFQQADQKLVVTLAHSWEDGAMEANGICFTINRELIAKVTGFPLKGKS